MDKEFDSEDQLALINQMINTAKNNIKEGMGLIFLVWGYALFFTAVLFFILLRMESTRDLAHFTWMILVIPAIIQAILIARETRVQLSWSYFDKLVKFLWIGFAITVVLTISSIFLLAYKFDIQLWFLIYPACLQLYGFALFVNGSILKFRPMIFGGVFSWICSMFMFLQDTGSDYHILLFALTILVAYIIPGHLLNKKARQNV